MNANPETPIRLMLVDDHAMVRQGLRMFLKLDPGLIIVGEAGSGEDALLKVADLAPDVILMDLILPNMSGIDTIRAILAAHPETAILALTSVLEDDYIVRAMQAGAVGYLLKDTEAGELIRAIRAAASGQIQLSPRVAARLLAETPATPPAAHQETLTEREIEVLRLVAGGQSNRQISQTLQITEKTVKTHMSNILSKLGFASRTQAALYAVKLGIVPRDS
jgi:two-component system, NarL family, response regulator LiaR